jgi:hypothetical protein
MAKLQRIMGHADPRTTLKIGHPKTSLDSAFIGLDEEELRRIVTQHQASLPRYRQASSCTLWLVIHTDTFPLTATVPDLHCDRTLAAASQDSTPDESGRFDAGDWAYCASVMCAANQGDTDRHERRNLHDGAFPMGLRTTQTELGVRVPTTRRQDCN